MENNFIENLKKIKETGKLSVCVGHLINDNGVNYNFSWKNVVDSYIEKLDSIKGLSERDKSITFFNWLLDTFPYSDEINMHEDLIDAGFPLIIATNIDRSLERVASRKAFREGDERAIEYAFNSLSLQHAGKLTYSMYKDKRAIVHAFGDINNLDIEDFAKKQKDIEKLYRKYISFSLALQQAFVRDDILFLGHDLNDPRSQFMFKLAKTTLQKLDPETYKSHYHVLVRSGEYDRLNQFLEGKQRSCFEVVKYEDQSEISNVLKKIKD